MFSIYIYVGTVFCNNLDNYRASLRCFMAEVLTTRPRSALRLHLWGYEKISSYT